MKNSPPLFRRTLSCVAVVLASTAAISRMPRADDKPNTDLKTQTDTDGSTTELGDDPLPWDLFGKPARDARKALNNFNISESELAFFYDRQPLDPDDPTLVKILFRMPQFGLDNMIRYAAANKDVDLNAVAKEPKKFFVEAFRISGRAKMVTSEKLLDREAANYSFSNYYRVVVDCDGVANPVVVCARKVPDQWKTAETLDEPTTRYAIFLKLDEAETEHPPLVFATDRMAWHPDRVDAARDIGKSDLLLSKLGMDYGLFDDVRPTNGDKTVPGECFYELMAAAKRASPGELQKQAASKLTQDKLYKLMTEPKKHHGQLLMVEGMARRIQKIKVNNKYFSERLGIDEYYEIDMLMKLDQKLQITYQAADAGGKGDESKKGPVFADEFPVIVCVSELPKGLTAGDNIKSNIRVPAFFFKLWAYKSRLVDEKVKGQLQKSPMLIGQMPQLVQSKTIETSYIGYVAVAVFVLAIGGIWLGLWRAGRRDDKYKAERLARQSGVEKPPGTDKFDPQDKPDFSGLK